MKFIRLFLLVLLVMPAFKVKSQNYFLMPENFYLKKGEKMNLRLTQSDDFTKESPAKFTASQTATFILYEGKKQTSIAGLVKDTTSVINFEPMSGGLDMIEMVSNTISSEMSRNKFLRNLGDDDPENIADKVKASNQLYYKEKYTNYTKTLFIVDKTNGNYDKPLPEEYDITIQQNPYKFNYGDDVSALVTFKGKPLANALVNLYVKTVSGNVFPQKLNADAGGLVYFKLSREGIYILRSKHYQVSTDKSADFESWRTTYTFAFSSANDLPNSYKEFGFGNKH
jgi:hypothetical protein